jgi:hypothetical protein
LQQLHTQDPHIKLFTAGKSKREQKSSAVILDRTHDNDLHFAPDRSKLAIGATSARSAALSCSLSRMLVSLGVFDPAELDLERTDDGEHGPGNGAAVIAGL